VDISRNASYLLDTDYVIDNGYIQVREDGGYLSRHNPMFLADLNWTSLPYGFFQFNSSEITLRSNDGNNIQSINVAELPVTGMQLVDSDSDSASISVKKADSDFSYLETVTVTKGNLFANMTIVVQSNRPDVSLEGLDLVVNSQGVIQQSSSSSLVVLDQVMKVCGQLVFAHTQPKVSNVSPQSPCVTQLSYDLQGESGAEIQILVGICAVSESDIQDSVNMSGLGDSLSVDVPDLPLTTFDYKLALREYNVSYVANRDFEVNRKFAEDPDFSLVFVNSEVAIFRFESYMGSSQRIEERFAR
jgi:hypothetical protein